MKKRPLHVAMILPPPEAGTGGGCGFHPAIQGLLEGLSGYPGLGLTVLVPQATERVPKLPASKNILIRPVRVGNSSGKYPGSGFLSRSWHLQRCLRQIQPDLVHGQGSEKEPAWVAVRSGFPSIITLHGLMGEVVRQAEHRHYLRYWVAAWLEKQALRRAQGVIALSPWAEERIRRFHPRVRLIPNAIRKAFYQLPDGSSRRPPQILFSGHLTPSKRPEGFIRVIHALWQEGLSFEAKMLGMGDPRHPYVQKIREEAVRPVRGRRIEVILQAKDLPKQVGGSDVLFHPSVLENMSTSIGEALAAGKCVVAADIPGNQSLLAGGAGLVFPRDHWASARQALARIVLDPALRKEIGKKARLRAKEFFPTHVAKETADFYRTVAHLRRRWG